ncbi:MAG: hypothetical protein AAFR96_09550 [Planctomycetota bacterium]
MSWSLFCGMLVLSFGVGDSISSERDQPVRVVGAWTHDSGLLPPVSFEAEAPERLSDAGSVRVTLLGTDGAERSMTILPQEATAIEGPPAIIDAEAVWAGLDAETRRDRMALGMDSIRRAVDRLLLASGYDVVGDDDLGEVGKWFGLFVDRATSSTAHLDGATMLYQSSLRVDEAEGTYAVSAATSVFNRDPVVMARMGLRVAALVAVWGVGFAVLIWLLRHHERRVRATGRAGAG